MAIVRPATRNDIPRILELYQELVISHSRIEDSRQPSRADYERILDSINTTPGYRLLVAEETGEIAGLMEFLIMPNLSHNGSPWALIEGLVVSRKKRRQGLGKMLIEYAVRQCREAGCYKIELSSDKRRVEAHEFYRSLGFKEAALGFRLYF